MALPALILRDPEKPKGTRSRRPFARPNAVMNAIEKARAGQWRELWAAARAAEDADIPATRLRDGKQRIPAKQVIKAAMMGNVAKAVKKLSGEGMASIDERVKTLLKKLHGDDETPLPGIERSHNYVEAWCDEREVTKRVMKLKRGVAQDMWGWSVELIQQLMEDPLVQTEAASWMKEVHAGRATRNMMIALNAGWLVTLRKPRSEKVRPLVIGTIWERWQCP